MFSGYAGNAGSAWSIAFIAIHDGVLDSGNQSDLLVLGPSHYATP